MPTSSRSFVFSLVLAASLPPILAQQQGLTPGTLVATTYGIDANGAPSPAGTRVFVVDPIARTSAPLPIAGFPASNTEYGDLLWLESRTSLLLTTFTSQAPWTAPTGCQLYRAVWSGSGFVAAPILTTVIPECITGAATVGSRIYFTTNDRFGNGSQPGCKLWKMPRAGGAATLVADVTALGANGRGGLGLTALGTTLHFFTYTVGTPPVPPGEHWAVDTTATPERLTRVGTLPLVNYNGTAVNFGAAGAVWDQRMGAFALAGNWGGLLWRDPIGNNVAQRPLPAAPFAWGDYLEAGIALDADNGTLYWGDTDGHVEMMRTMHAPMQWNAISLVPGGTNLHLCVGGLAYVPGAAQYLPDGPEGCPRLTEWMVNSTNSRPSAGNSSFRFQLDSYAGSAFLVLGSDNAMLGGVQLPWELPGSPGCAIGTNGDLGVFFTTRGLFGLSVPAPIPTALVGCRLYTQWVVPQVGSGMVVSDTRRLEVR